jgi:CheY-like chemotaxis protein
MSAVLGIIMSHGGALQLFSQKGQGTTFKVYLPVQASDSAERESIPQLPLAPWQGSGTILLAEDEDQVRLIAATMLNKLGFRVIEASNGKEALELWRKNAADITLVLTDVGMPVMNGYKLFRKLKKLKPDLPIIISSGFGDGDVTSRISREDLAGLIGKPYSFDNFQEVLKSVLDASS